jgi:hypothetical protein
MPGPGAYTGDRKNEGPKFGFGSSSKASSIFVSKNTPGPGTYTSRSMTSDAGAAHYSMTPRRPDFTPGYSKFGPGPGTYTRNYKEKSPAFSLGRSKRKDVTKMDGVPGPGNY